ncbi:MAG: hypothetical protein VYA84_21635 [Planctomycetota bacterium]|nr:hypothetical protein [Planctomycetota bacterium]
MATKILDAANETADNAAHYSMLKLAADIAALAAGSEIVKKSIDLMDRFYEIDEPKVRLAALIGVTKNIDSQSKPAALSAVIGFCHRAIDRNDYVAAERLLTISEVNFREAASRREVTELASRVKRRQRQLESVRDHLQKLLEDPEDPDANLAVGRFRRFGRNDWFVGLKNLARGSDDTLREIAQLELAGGHDMDRQILIADRWWQYAENVEGEAVVRAKLHAGSYYRIAVDSLQGFERAEAATRLREAESLGEISVIEMIAGGDVVPPKPAAPAPMNEWKVVYEMPASYSDVAVGGSGRYLIFRLDSLKKLAFFDVMKREITQYVPSESSDIRFTAGANEFFIATRPQNVVERWSLETFKRLSAVKLPLENPVEFVMMGSASDGPIYVGAQHGPGGFLNPRSLKPIPYQVVDHRYQRAGIGIRGLASVSEGWRNSRCRP